MTMPLTTADAAPLIKKEVEGRIKRTRRVNLRPIPPSAQGGERGTP